MPGRVDQRYELPLAVLGLLAEREMDGGEVIAELRALLGLGYRCAWDSVDSTIEALESEGLVESDPRGGAAIYRATTAGAGRAAVGWRAVEQFGRGLTLPATV